MSAEQKNPANAERIWEQFRRWGYIEADLDPLGFAPRGHHPELPHEGGAEEMKARAVYCGSIAAEFEHIPDPERRRWLSERLEAGPQSYDAKKVLEQLVEADLFEQSLQAIYTGAKRFSLEGATALIPMLEALLEQAAGYGVEETVLAMSHRGRLNVVANTVQRPLDDIYAGFEDVDPRSVLGGGDVKYHQGATHPRNIAGREMMIRLISNPSHLEAVDPVLMGRCRAKQDRRGEHGRDQVLPVMMHGDSAFAGQGVCAETLNLTELEGYEVGGVIHIIVNNQLGFTTAPRQYTSSLHSSDLAKRLPIPILHVNGEDLEAVTRLAKLAVDYRKRFASDIFIDLIGYRRHGHSEIDDPTLTQPLMYQRISQHPTLHELFAKKIGVDVAPLELTVRERGHAARDRARQSKKKPLLYQLPSYWDEFFGGEHRPEHETPTGLETSEIARLGEKLTTAPEGFHLHAKAAKLLEQRREMAAGRAAIDYGMAEALAFASLAEQGAPVRLTGQDSRRGTFSHRHSYLIDIENEQLYAPLQHISPQQARVEIHNSSLSEAAVLGFEYGYSRDYPEGLTIWEAQFGDFANGAQIIVDQFITASEEKWGLLTGLVLMLPHGYEGQGPEHSSARIERYLQLCARHNMQVCQPSTAAQHFHMLRRQAMRKWRKPLVAITPKSMLRHPLAASPVADFARWGFRNVIDWEQTEPSETTRILVASGKLVHELQQERARLGDERTAILSLEQLYPFPEAEVSSLCARYLKAKEMIWVQEEPANMGALSFVRRRLRRAVPQLPVLTIKRAAAASPATGSGKAHTLEQKTLLSMAFSS